MIVNFSIICSIVTHNHHQCILVNLDNIMLYILLFQFVRSEHKGLPSFSRSLFVSNSLFLWLWMSLKIQQIHAFFSSVSSIGENNIHVEPLSSDMNQIINRQFVTRILPFQLTEHVFFLVQHNFPDASSLEFHQIFHELPFGSSFITNRLFQFLGTLRVVISNVTCHHENNVITS